jgi:hypothetical protein
VFKHKALKDKRDEGKNSGGKPPKGKFLRRDLLEPIRDPRIQEVLSFMRGAPVDVGEIRDAREFLLSPPRNKGPEMD